MPDNCINIRLQQSTPIPLDVEFSCQQGEILVIVGPSGSGKTTVLRSIAGLETPASGKIVCDGKTWLDTENKHSISLQQRRVGMVFQHYALFPHLTAQQNIEIALGHLQKPGRVARTRDLLSMVHLKDLETRLPHKLSGGQQQRVAVARALARDPDVLLLDEPFSAVDQQTRRKLVRELAQLRKQVKIPIIHVTHDLNEARRIADKICIIRHGKALQIDTPQEIMAKPGSAEVASLVGHYNVYSGVIQGHDEERKKTFVRWSGYVLETSYRPEFELQTEIDWVIPAENLILHRHDRPSRGEQENPVQGRIDEFIQLGESSSVSIKLDEEMHTLHMMVPTHVARRNKLGTGKEISVSLLSEGIHLMEKTAGSK